MNLVFALHPSAGVKKSKKEDMKKEGRNNQLVSIFAK